MKRERSPSRAAESPSSKRSRSSTSEQASGTNTSPKPEDTTLHTSQRSVSPETVSSSSSDFFPDTTATSIETFVLNKIAFPLIHKPGVAYATKKNEAPEGYFYKGTTLPIAVGDVVARIRGPDAIKNGLMRNEWDIVDGLYRLEKFHATVGKTAASKSAAPSKKKKRKSAEELEEDEMNKRLSKKARLTYPQLSKPKDKGEDWFHTSGEPWVPLGDLRPALLQPPPGSTIVANNLSVSNMKAFKLLNTEPEIACQQIPEQRASDEGTNETAEDCKIGKEDSKLAEQEFKAAGEESEEIEKESEETAEPISKSMKNNGQYEQKTKEEVATSAEETKESPTTISEPKVQSRRKEPPIYFVHLKDKIYAAITEIPGAIRGKTNWEVEKLRGKRVLIYDADHEDVIDEGLTTEDDDPWVKKLVEEKPGWCKDKVVVVEYLAHYAGWPDEDDEWELSVSKSSRVTEQLKADFEPTAAKNLAAANHFRDWIRKGDGDEELSSDEESEDEEENVEE